MPLKVIKIKTSLNWYIRGTYQGVTIFISSGTRNRAVAERKKKELEDEIDAHGSPRKDLTFGEAVELYIKSGGSDKFLCSADDIDAVTREWKRGPMQEFERILIRRIDQLAVDEAAARAYPNASAQTRNRQFYTPTLAVLNYMAKLNLYPQRQWMRPKVKKSDTRKASWFKTLEAAAWLFDHASPHMRALQVFFSYTGARPSEGIELEIKDVDLEKSWAVLNATKTDATRGVPLHPLVVRMLKEVIGDRKEGRVFLTQANRPYKSRRDAQGRIKGGGGYFRSAFKGAMRRANEAAQEGQPKLKGFTPYSMRHTLNNWLIMAGVETSIREAIMGHDNGSTNARYSDVPQNHLVEIISRLPDFTDFSRVKAQNLVMFTLHSVKKRQKRPRPLSRKRQAKTSGKVVLLSGIEPPTSPLPRKKRRVK